MVRNRQPREGSADAQLIEALRARGVDGVTVSRLEGWRAKGYLPPSPRQHLGRGQGSRSLPVSEELIYRAEEIARTVTQGSFRRMYAWPWWAANATPRTAQLLRTEMLAALEDNHLDIDGLESGDHDGAFDQRLDLAAHLAATSKVQGHNANWLIHRSWAEFGEEDGYPMTEWMPGLDKDRFSYEGRLIRTQLTINPDDVGGIDALATVLREDHPESFAEARLRQLQGLELKGEQPLDNLRRPEDLADTIRGLTDDELCQAADAYFRVLRILHSVILFGRLSARRKAQLAGEPWRGPGHDWAGIERALNHPLWRLWFSWSGIPCNCKPCATRTAQGVASLFVLPGFADDVRDYAALLMDVLEARKPA
ncbi:hypothetical protein GCM10017674_78300 [Streptomyces gardneri]|uniref:Uncharacterized protein n=1 Tax=Streptomyces gardneri TaxID=66892 RepID=A0A4Y3RMZ3_9ACTN|nr:hypothetical protein SGA01_27950 [Streptomyces gardneri]GHH22497.1 hypothetical protein GCM10017674_78300 [Streptomyces gardneri]